MSINCPAMAANWRSIYRVCALLAIIIVNNIGPVQSIYDPNNAEVKQRPIIREQLRGRQISWTSTTTTARPTVQIHDQYSRVTMQRSTGAPPPSNHFGRSDSNVMRIGKSSSTGNQPQQQAVPEAAPLTRVNVRENYNQLPASRGSFADPQQQQQRPSSSNVNRQGRVHEYDEADNDVVQYGTECPPQGTGRFPYVMDCRQFLNCWKGRGYIQSCAPGTLFNSETNECDSPSKVKCATYNDPTKGRLESPNISRIPKSQRFNEPALTSRSGFDDPQTPPQQQVEAKCPRRHSGLVPHPMYCDKFLNCANGHTYVQDCGPETVFNPIHSVCDWPRNVECGQRRMYAEVHSQPNGNNGDDNYQGQNSNQNENFREPKYHGGEGQLDIRMDAESQFQRPFVPTNNNQRPIYNRPIATTTTRNPHAVELPSQSLQPPPVPTTEIPRHHFGGRNKQHDQQQTAGNWQLPWQQGQRPQVPTTTPVPLLPEPEFVPNYNRQYYNPQNQGREPAPNVPEQELPLSQALQMLMKPYLANKPTNETNNQQTMNWSSLMAQMSGSSTTPRGSLEQESMNGGVWTPEINTNNDSDEAWVPSTTPLPPQPILPPGHNADWHRRHPHVPMPGSSNQGGGSAIVPPGHSADWHRRHPNVPVGGRHHHGHHHNQNHPYHRNQNRANNEPAGGVTNVIPLDSRFNSQVGYQCAGKFDCNNTKCVEQDQVCDGKNDCGNRLDEINCEHIGYQVRLSNENGAEHEGRIEIKVYDQWGYVCDDGFGMRDADVLCKELGFSLGASEVRGNSHYPPNKNMKRNDHTVFMMDQMECKGNEKSLRECDFNGWGVHDCNEEEVVGVVCKLPVMTCPLDYWLCDTSQECIPTGFLCDNVYDCADHSDENEKHCNAPVQVRLVNGRNALEGRVEINYRGIWGTVCDDDFHNKEAQVVCHSLGFHGPARVAKNKFGAGVGTIWLDQVNCRGNETNVEDCSHWHWGEHNCGHTEDVGVECTAGPPPRTTTPRYGRSNQETVQYHDFDQHPSLPNFAIEKASLLQADQCGRVLVRPQVSSSNVGYKVINGSVTQHGRHPWQAALRVKGQGKSSHWCGAVLISRFHVLTAAHCLVGFSKGAYFIRFGDHNTEINEQTEIEIFIENMYIHEDFRKGQHMNNDLALIVLKAPVRYSDYIQPICLPQKNAMYFPGMNCTISGWGSIQSGKSNAASAPATELRAGTIPILDDDTCRQGHVYGNAVTDTMFCAGSLDEGIDACMGDSGGPLVCESDGVHKLYGIISWGQHCGFANKPGVYVRVSHYLDWIQAKLNHSMTNFGV